jgi:hypothetical protein
VSVSSLAAQPRRAENLPKVDLNTGAESALASLPGVGNVLAASIVASRPYGSVDELAKAGVSPRRIEQLRPFVTIAAIKAVPIQGAVSPATRGPGITPIPVESAGVQPIPVPSGTMKTVPVRSGAVTPAAASGTSGEGAAASPANAPSLVWVDASRKVFYRRGSPSYGKVEPGRWMTEAAAVEAGYREAMPVPVGKTRAQVPTKKP